MPEAAFPGPDGFDAYWGGVLAELDSTPAEPEVEAIPLRETDFATMSGIRLTSIGPYRLYGYLGVPKGDGPFPALYWPPKYMSVHQMIPQGSANAIRSRFVTFSLAGRGQRNADKPFAAMFPGLLTEGIESPATYVFRGIAADAVRGLEFLNSLEFVDRTRVAAIGNDVAMQALALRPMATHLACTPELFLDSLAVAERARAYPLEEYNDFLRSSPSARDAVAATLSCFDLRAFAPGVAATTLIMAGPEGSVLGPEAIRPFTDSIRGETTVHASQRSGYKDGLFEERWVSEALGFDAPIVPPHWR